MSTSPTRGFLNKAFRFPDTSRHKGSSTPPRQSNDIASSNLVSPQLSKLSTSSSLLQRRTSTSRASLGRPILERLRIVGEPLYTPAEDTNADENLSPLSRSRRDAQSLSTSESAEVRKTLVEQGPRQQEAVQPADYQEPQPESEDPSSTTTSGGQSTQPSSSGSTPDASESANQMPIPSLVLPTTICEEAARLPTVQRFHCLLDYARMSLKAHGTYRINSSNYLTFVRRHSTQLTLEHFHYCLAAAQDALPYPQPEGPALDTLQVLQYLWSTSVHLLNQIIASNTLSLEVFGWGVYGLTGGFTSEDELVQGHRTRLHNALTEFPELARPFTERNLDAAQRQSRLTRARRSIHICAVMLLQTVRRDWMKLRWGFVVLLCESWLKHFRADEELEGVEEPEEAGIEIVDGKWEETDDAMWIWVPGQKKMRQRRPSIIRRHSLD